MLGRLRHQRQSPDRGRGVLRETLEDIMYAVRTCLKVHRCVEHLWEAAQCEAKRRAADAAHRAEVLGRMQSIVAHNRPKFRALRVFSREVSDLRTAEQQWDDLQSDVAKAVATPGTTPSGVKGPPSRPSTPLLLPKPPASWAWRHSA